MHPCHAASGVADIPSYQGSNGKPLYPLACQVSQISTHPPPFKGG